MARQTNSRAALTKAVKVGKAKTGSFGKRVAGTAGRTVSGGRGGMTDQGIAAGSRAYGRSAPGTGIGGGGGKTTGSVVESTKGAGGTTRTPPASGLPKGGTPGAYQGPDADPGGRTPYQPSVPAATPRTQGTMTTLQAQAKAPARATTTRTATTSKTSTAKAPVKKKPVILAKGGGGKNVAGKPGGTAKKVIKPSTNKGSTRNSAKRAVGARKTAPTIPRNKNHSSSINRGETSGTKGSKIVSRAR